MNWKSFGRKGLWPKREMYYPCIFLEGLRIST
jgi:hypothetical protein